MEIRSVSRLKYQDRCTMKLKNSSTIKVEFVSNLLPEFLYIWSVRVKVKPYVNRVRKCFNCFRWGHLSIFYKGKETCSRYGKDHNVDACNLDGFCCVNCGGSHHPFDQFCSIFYKYKLVNTVMAFCNVSQFKAKRLFKTKNVTYRTSWTGFPIFSLLWLEYYKYRHRSEPRKGFIHHIRVVRAELAVKIKALRANSLVILKWVNGILLWK